MKKFIIAANLGQIRVLRYQAAGEDPIEQAHLIEEPAESAKQHVKTISETVTDQSGRFGRGTPIGFETGMSYGEEHHLEDEMERSALKKIAAQIDLVLDAEKHPSWILAAPKSILAKLQKAVSPSARKTLLSTVGNDLTRCPLKELEARFL